MAVKKILLVDDSKTALMMERSILENRTAYQCVTAMDGVEALAKVREEKPDLVLMDVVMPQMNGFETCKKLREHADTRAAKVFEGMGIYCPTLGIIGAVLGLMAVMQNLADPSKLGHGIAAAFTATVYGIGLANLFFLPVAAKLKGAIASQTQVREMVIEGMLSIAQGENPRSIEAKLQGYLH